MDYRLVHQTPELANGAILRLEQALLIFSGEYGDGWYNPYPPYREVWYAIWEALLRFPDDPQAKMWRWKMAYYMALAGEGEQANSFYAAQIAQALKEQKLSPDELPGWFQSSELIESYFTRKFVLQTAPVPVPGQDVGYLVRIGPAPGLLDAPGASCFLVVGKSGTYTPHLLVDGFESNGFFIGLRNVVDCDTRDVTGDGQVEIVIERYTGGHAGETLLSVFRLDALPPPQLSFSSAPGAELRVWNGGVIQNSSTDPTALIQVGEPFYDCDLYGITTYQWNGDWFERSSGTVHFDAGWQPDEVEQRRCWDEMRAYIGLFARPQKLQILEEVISQYMRPGVKSPLIAELLSQKALFAALNGSEDQAKNQLAEIAQADPDFGGVWQKPAQQFLDVYHTPKDMYRACSILNACVPYKEDPSDAACHLVDLCDYGAALESLVEFGFPSLPIEKIAAALGSAGVQVLNHGQLDFNGDGKQVVWLTIQHPGGWANELWLIAQQDSRNHALFVDRLYGQLFEFAARSDGLGIVMVEGGRKTTFEITRHSQSGAPVLATSSAGIMTPADQSIVDYQELILSNSFAEPELLYQQLLAIKKDATGCPSQGEYSYSYDCVEFTYTLALAAELTGRQAEAVRNYYNTWLKSPWSGFATLARMKLDG